MSENIVFLDGKTLTPETLVSLQKFDSKIDLTESAWEAVKKSREVSFRLKITRKSKEMIKERNFIFSQKFQFGAFSRIVYQK